jgi:DNA-binding response OmpR family regulator
MDESALFACRRRDRFPVAQIDDGTKWTYHRGVTGGPARILVVEDDADLRRMYRTALMLAGFDVRDAAIGIDALRYIDEDPPDLIVLDLMLPDINGMVIRQEIAAHAHTQKIPIVIVTGALLDLTSADVACVLRKPVSPDELVRTVQSCLRSGAPSAGL